MYKKGSFPLRICSVNVANRKKMRIWSRLLKELSMGNFFFFAVIPIHSVDLTTLHHFIVYFEYDEKHLDIFVLRI